MVWKNGYVKNKKGRSIAEQLLILRNIIEQCTEWNSTLFDNYVDSEQQFDSIHRESLWSIQMLRIVKLLYETIQCAALEDGEDTDQFRVRTVVKHDCTMSEFFFFASYIHVFHNERELQEIRWNSLQNLKIYTSQTTLSYFPQYSI